MINIVFNNLDGKQAAGRRVLPVRMGPLSKSKLTTDELEEKLNQAVSE
jgi:hypothetical protein